MAVRDANIRDGNKLAKVLDFLIANKIQANINTMVPGRVVEYDTSTKRANIHPLLYRVYTDGRLKSRAILLDVPIVAPATGGTMMHQPINTGDVVMVIFSERGLEEFKKNWGDRLSEPTPGRYFDDAVAIRWGVETIAPVDDEAFCIQSEDGSTYFKLKNGLIELKCGDQMFRMTPQRGDLS